MSESKRSKKRMAAGAATGAVVGHSTYVPLRYGLYRKTNESEEPRGTTLRRAVHDTYDVKGAKNFIMEDPRLSGKAKGALIVTAPALVGGAIGTAIGSRKVKKNAFLEVSKASKKTQAAAAAGGGAAGVAAGHAVTSGVFAHKAAGPLGMTKPEAFKTAFSPKGAKGLWDLTGMLNQPKLKLAYRAGLVAPAVVGGAGGAVLGAKIAGGKKPVKKNLGGGAMISAFGVDHGEEVAKFSFKPVTSAFKAMKFGNATSVPKAAAVGWARGGQQAAAGNMGTLRGFGQKVGRAAEYGFKRSPGTALATVGAVGAVPTAIGAKKHQ